MFKTSHRILCRRLDRQPNAPPSATPVVLSVFYSQRVPESSTISPLVSRRRRKCKNKCIFSCFEHFLPSSFARRRTTRNFRLLVRSLPSKNTSLHVASSFSGTVAFVNIRSFNPTLYHTCCGRHVFSFYGFSKAKF